MSRHVVTVLVGINWNKELKERISMSSERLESIEDELKSVLDQVQNSITYQLPTKSGDDRRRTVHSLENRLTEADSLLRELQVELRKAPLIYQQQVSTRVAHYRTDLASLRRQVYSGSSLREELFSKQQQDDDYEYDGGEKAVLLRNTDTLKRASGSLARAHQVSADTDQIAVGVMEDLDDQKATLVRTRNRLTDVDHEMDRAKTLVRSIACKTIQNRLILIVVIIVELLLLVGIMIWKFKK